MEQTRCYGCMQMKTSPVCEHCGYDEQTKNADHQLPVGTVLREQYLIGKALGQGGFGITYLGWDLYLDVPVAVKEYYPNGAVMRESAVTMEVSCMGGEVGARFHNNKDRFMREAKMLARFAQVPEIVQVRNFFLANNTAYIVMEYIEGVDLKHYVRQKGGKLSVDECFAILVPVMQALEKVHKTGLVHRDISPDNIMMLPNGRAKLLDFGAVRDVGMADPSGALTQSTEAILKQGYAPIEQYQSRGSLGPWTDVYAMGATIWYCLTGSVPPDAPARMLQDLDDLPWEKSVPGLEPQQIQALNHAMALRSTQRTASVEAFVAELLKTPDPPVPDPDPDPDPKPSRIQRIKEKLKEDKGLFPAIVGTLLVAIALCVVLAWPDPSEPTPPVSEQSTPTPGSDAEEIAHDVVGGSCGYQLKWELDRQTGELTILGSGDMDDYTRPDDLSDNGSKAPWYELRSEIRALTVGDKVTSIGANAFAGCRNLYGVTLGAGLLSIDEYAFENTPLTAVELPEGLERIESSAFRGTNLQAVSLPDALMYLGHDSFAQCAQLEQVTVGRYTLFNYDFCWHGVLPFSDENEQIPENFVLYNNGNPVAADMALLMGYSLVNLTDVTWTDQGQCGDHLWYYFDEATGFLKIEGTGAMWDFNGDYQSMEERHPKWTLSPWYSYRDSIRILSVHDAVTTIGEHAFHGCGSLTDLYLGQGLKEIKGQAFCGTNIDELLIPDSVRLIEDCAFNWCVNLSLAILPEGLEVLQQDAFANCSGLKQLYMGAGTEVDGQGSPFGPHEGGEVPKDLTIYSSDPTGPAAKFAEEEGHAYETRILEYGGGLDDVSWAEGQCGDDVFWYINGDTLVLYGTGATYYFNASNDEELAALEAAGHSGRKEQPGYYKYRRSIGHIVILPGVTEIGTWAFTDMENLSSIDFGTVQYAGNAVHHCGIQEVYLPESMTVVGGYLLSGCYDLQVVTIAGGSERVESCLFANCTALREVWWVGGQEIIGGDLLHDEAGSGAANEHVTFYVREGSDAQAYAEYYGISYEIIE